jgi:Na+/melibiose symporter-like transporter
MVFAMLGVLIGAGVAPHIVEIAGGGRHGYGVMALVIAATCGCAMLVTFFTVRRIHHSDRADSPARRDEPGGLRRVLANREYVRLWVCYVLAMSGSSLFTAMVPYFVTHVLERTEGDVGTALFAWLIGTLLAMPLWSKLQRAWGGWRAFMLATLCYVVICASFVALPHGFDFGATLPFYFLLGVPFAGIQLLPFTLLAHIAHADASAGLRQEGLYTGIWTAGEKLALAIGPATAGAGLSLTGYVSGAAQQSSASLGGLQGVMALGPALFLLPCLVLLAMRKPMRN